MPVIQYRLFVLLERRYTPHTRVFSGTVRFQELPVTVGVTAGGALRVYTRVEHNVSNQNESKHVA